MILLENVEEFRHWGPIDAAGIPCPERKGATFDAWVGELKRLGYRVQWRELRACDYGAPTIRRRLFLVARRDGLPIVWPAPTHGAPTSAGVLAGTLKPWRTAAEIIDWSLPCHSIFLTREEGRAAGVNRPLADATMARIAKGVKRYVLAAARPFIVPVKTWGGGGNEPLDLAEPARTVTAGKRGEQAIVAPHLAAYYGAGSGGSDRSASAEEPIRTVVTENRHAVVAPHLIRVDQTSGDAARKGVHDIGVPLNTLTTAGSFAVTVPYLVPRYGEREGQEPRTRSVEVPMPVVVPTANGGSLVAAHLSRQFGGSVGSDADEPIGTVTAGGGGKTALITAGLCVKNNHGDKPMYGLDEPTHTVVAGGTHHAVVAAHLSTMRNSDKPFQGADEPAHTVTAGGARTAIVAAFLAQHNGATTPNPGRPADEPLSTLTASGSHQAIVEASLLSHSYGSNTAGGAGDPAEPLKTVTAGGFHAAEVRAFMVKYYGEGSVDQAVADPLHTVPTRDRFGLVTTTIDGEPYAVVDIGMRMLSPRELFRAQGFPDSYVIDRGVGPDGNALALTKTAQVRMCGNSVCPPIAEALVRANYAEDQVSASPTPRRRRLEPLPDLFRLQAAE